MAREGRSTHVHSRVHQALVARAGRVRRPPPVEERAVVGAWGQGWGAWRGGRRKGGGYDRQGGGGLGRRGRPGRRQLSRRQCGHDDMTPALYRRQRQSHGNLYLRVGVAVTCAQGTGMDCTQGGVGVRESWSRGRVVSGRDGRAHPASRR